MNGHGMDYPASIPGRTRDFFITTSRPVQRMHDLPGAISPSVKSSDHEVNYTPPPSTEIKNIWSYTSITQYVLNVWRLIRYGDFIPLP